MQKRAHLHLRKCAREIDTRGLIHDDRRVHSFIFMFESFLKAGSDRVLQFRPRFVCMHHKSGPYRHVEMFSGDPLAPPDAILKGHLMLLSHMNMRLASMASNHGLLI